MKNGEKALQLNYKIENPTDTEKPWLVFVNGLFASLLSWEESVQNFTKEFRVLRYDGRGQGESPRPMGDYSLVTLVQDLTELLEDLEVQTCSFIGLSNGGRVALEYARQNPSRVKSLVAADSYDETSTLLKLKLKSWLDANRIGGPSHRFEVATPWIWGESIVQKKPELLEFYRNRAGMEKVHVIEGLIKGAMENYSIDISKINCPTLLCVGEEDLLTPPFKHQEMVKKLNDGELRVVPGGHASLLENPETLRNVILPWLQKVNKQNHPEIERKKDSEWRNYGMD
ncbi:MAG: alpha/beta hydrolase [Halobacteriovoraceae bacterium]|nr:alpha/beta hydrolase [Halobacteriovoraceae bacterium]